MAKASSADASNMGPDLEPSEQPVVQRPTSGPVLSPDLEAPAGDVVEPGSKENTPELMRQSTTGDGKGPWGFLNRTPISGKAMTDAWRNAVFKEILMGWYTGFMRIRVLFFSLVCIAISTALGLGIALQMLFSVFITKCGTKVHLVVMLLMPTFVLVTSAMVSELFDLAADSQQPQCFRYFVSKVAILIGDTCHATKDKILLAMCLFQDACILFPCVVMMLMGNWILQDILHILLLSVTYATFCLVVIQILLKVAIVATKRRDALQDHVGTKNADRIKHNDKVKKVMYMEQYKIMSGMQSVAFLCAGLALLLILFIYLEASCSTDTEPQWPVGFWLFAFAMLCLTIGIMRHVPMNGLFPCTVFSFFIVGLGTMAMVRKTMSGKMNPTTDKAMMMPPGANWSSTHAERYAYMYPVCEMAWGDKHRSEKDLSIIDLGLFAQGMYANENETVKEIVIDSFANTSLDGGIVLEEIGDLMDVGRWGVWKVPQAKTRVVAIRGSNQNLDWLVNAHLWTVVALLNIYTYFIPVTTIMGERLVAKMNAGANIDWWLGLPEAWKKIESATKTAIQKSLEDNYTTVMTGHSLGGGLAQIVATHQRIPAAVFSPVGTVFSMQRFNMDMHDLYRSVTAVWPETDKVPAIDRQGGFVQNVACRLSSSVACHDLKATICELLNMCGDPRGRGFEQMCIDAYDYYKEGAWQKAKKEVAAEKATYAKFHP